MSHEDEFYAPQSSYQSFIRKDSQPVTVPYWLSLSRSTDQASPSINGSDVMQLTFNVVSGSDTGDFASNTRTVPEDWKYLISYNYDWSIWTAANGTFISTYLDLNGAGQTAADSMSRFAYTNTRPRIFVCDTRIWDLTAWDEIEFWALLSSSGATTFTMSGSSWRFAHISIQKIA